MRALVLLLSLGLFLVGCASNAPLGRKPARVFTMVGGRPQVEAFDGLLAHHATRAECERVLREFDGEPVRVINRRQLLAARPPLPPTRRAFLLLARWRNATYAQTIDDCRMLACFDRENRLVAYEQF